MTPQTFVVARLTVIARRLQAICEPVWPFLYGAAADLVVLAGVAAMAYGIGLIYRPTAFIFLGAILIIIGVRGAQPTKPAGGDQ